MQEKFSLQPGDIIIVNNLEGGFFSSAIRFFTNSWSHTALGFFPFVNMRVPSATVFEANLTVGITDWYNKIDDLNENLRVYRWTTSELSKKMQDNLWTLYDKYNGNTYGVFQILYFVWRWICEKLHFPKRWYRKNFFPDKEICTEIVYVSFTLMTDSNVSAALSKLDRDQNTVHPGDIIDICEFLCELKCLERVYNRERA